LSSVAANRSIKGSNRTSGMVECFLGGTLEPLPADGPADPWFRPVWEDGDDDSLPEGRASVVL
jgi:hypothetical protein